MLLLHVTRKPTREGGRDWCLRQVSKSKCSVVWLWPQSWLFYPTAPWTTCASLQQNWHVRFQNIIFTRLATHEQINIWTCREHHAAGQLDCMAGGTERFKSINDYTRVHGIKQLTYICVRFIHSHGLHVDDVRQESIDVIRAFVSVHLQALQLPISHHISPSICKICFTLTARWNILFLQRTWLHVKLNWTTRNSGPLKLR